MRTTQYKGHFNDDRGYVAYYNSKTIMSRVDAVYPEGVKDTDIGKMVRLSKHLQPGANYLGYKGNKIIGPMDVVRIGGLIGVGESQTKRFIKRMTETGMIVRGMKRYYLNPIYFLNGKHVSDELYWLFHTQLNDVLRSGCRIRMYKGGMAGFK